MPCKEDDERRTKWMTGCLEQVPGAPYDSSMSMSSRHAPMLSAVLILITPEQKLILAGQGDPRAFVSNRIQYIRALSPLSPKV